MTGKARSVHLEIDHQRLSLRTDRDEAFLQELASFLNQNIKALRQAAPAVPTQQVYLLVALQLVDELFAERAASKQLSEALRQRGEALIQMLDQELGATRASNPEGGPQG